MLWTIRNAVARATMTTATARMGSLLLSVHPFTGDVVAAQVIAAHESPRTTKLYDRTNDQITLDEIERIAI
jgi:hypothetical protein